VVYDADGRCDEWRKKVCVVLGLWHPYKQANLVIWKRFGRSFLARMFHTLFPGKLFFNKPKLRAIVGHFNVLRLAYKQIKKPLKEALAMSGLNKHQAGYLQNMQALFEFYIPVVSYNSLILIS
jgi:hypothetical protein